MTSFITLTRFTFFEQKRHFSPICANIPEFAEIAKKILAKNFQRYWARLKIIQ
jgi:hypothetical protein